MSSDIRREGNDLMEKYIERNKEAWEEAFDNRDA